MDGSKVAGFRTAVVGCFREARAALSDLCDALATDVNAQSLPELSESPFFRRLWPSIYKGLGRGRIDRSALRQVFATPSLSHPQHHQRAIPLCLDSSQ